jgi:hypothetical protein
MEDLQLTTLGQRPYSSDGSAVRAQHPPASPADAGRLKPVTPVRRVLSHVEGIVAGQYDGGKGTWHFGWHHGESGAP